MKQSYAAKPKREDRKDSRTRSQLLPEYELGSPEAKAMLDDLASRYAHPAPSAKEVRAMLDNALQDRTLTEALHKMREEE